MVTIEHERVASGWTVELGDQAATDFAALPDAAQQALRRGLADLPTAAAERRGGSPLVWRGYVERWIVDFTRDSMAQRLAVVRLREDSEWLDQRRRNRRRLRMFAAVAAMTVLPLGLVALFAVVGRAPDAPKGTQFFAEVNHAHVFGTVKYDRSPPAGGPHWSFWARCGVYATTVPPEAAVHSLEHGSVWVTYRPGLSEREVGQLRAIVQNNYLGNERYLLLSPHPSQKNAVVATAWGARLVLAHASDPRLLAFIRHFVAGPQTTERNGYCFTNGVGSPLS